jgi:VWFA-related protein
MNKAPFLIAVVAAAQQSPPEPVFRAGTRLVEVEVIVRSQPVRPPGLRASLAYFLDSGPPFGPPGSLANGLTKDDFTLFDQGKRQPIAVFSVGRSDDTKPVSLPPGAVSNRTDNRGQPLNNATVVLVDLLNTPWDLTEYARQGTIKLLRSLGETDTNIAVYSLGENLHMLRDFGDDPQTLSPDVAGALRDYGDLLALEGGGPAAADVHGRITVKAAKSVIQHLSGFPGRKNLVWLAQAIRLPPAVMALLQRANIVLYPVNVRGVGGFASLESEYATRELGTASGGRGFFDAMDLTFAVRAAQEDSVSAYVLGYYPPERMLDGQFHKINVKLRDEAFEVHYRSGYLATKAAVPLASSTIGLTAQAALEAQHPGLYDVRVTVDLHDIHLDRKDGRFTGEFDVSVPDASAKGTVKSARFAINLTDEQLAEALEKGFAVLVKGAESESGEIRVVVSDRATGVAGSVRVPVAR